MTYRNIFTPVIASGEDVAALTATMEIAQKFGAEPSALILALHLSSSYMDKEAPLSIVLKDIAARALLDEAIAVDADMLVLGAYGHSRARELLFRGVTRELLTASSIPLFMAH